MARPRLELVFSRYERRSPFDALLAMSDRDAEAAEGLALAYAALDRDERGALFASVLHDAEDAGRSPAGPLALLLAVETDRELAGRIARALTVARPAGRARGTGWAWGSNEEGGVALARERTDDVALMAVTWRGARVDVVQPEPVPRGVIEDRTREALGVPESAEALALDAAIDALAAQLWRARRLNGPLPSGLRALASLFAPYR